MSRADRLHHSCRTRLSGWRPPDPGQDELRGRFLQHLADRPDGWSRGCPGAHLTASSLICHAPSRQVLLTLHARFGRWLQTGGHLEPADPSIEAAALREATEESGLGGLVVDPNPLLLSRHEVPCGVVRPTYHLDVQFLVIAVEPAQPHVGEESTDVGWFPVSALPPTDRSVRDLVAAAGTRLGWSTSDDADRSAVIMSHADRPLGRS